MDFIGVVVEIEIPFSLAWIGRCDINMEGKLIRTIIEKKFVKDGKLGTFENSEIRRERNGFTAFRSL